MQPGSEHNRAVPQGLPLEMLEPCAAKVACTVLRGLGAGNSPRLPDDKTAYNDGAALLLGERKQSAPHRGSEGDDSYPPAPSSLAERPRFAARRSSVQAMARFLIES